MKIKESRNYQMFELTAVNRDIGGIGPLLQSMKTYGWIDAYPMHVVKNGVNKHGQGKLLIKAGHHRFYCAEKLGIPVKYVICDDDAVIHELERASKKWSMKDYLYSYWRSGLPSYKCLKDFCERTDINITMAMSILSSGGNETIQGKIFKSGKFEVTDLQFANVIEDIVIYIKNCNFPYYNDRQLVRALSLLFRTPEFRPNVLKQKIKSHIGMMRKQLSTDEYLNMIEGIYNKQSSNKIPLAFMAKEASRKRMPEQLRKNKQL